jgi:hypothetical protein
MIDRRKARAFFAVKPAEGAARYLVSDVALDGGLDELGIERLAQVVYLSASGLWAGNLESTREKMEEVLHEQPSARPPEIVRSVPVVASETPATRPKVAAAPGATRIRAGFEYAAIVRGDPGITQEIGVSLGALRTADTFDWGGVVRIGALLPQRANAAGVEVDTQGVTFALGAAGERRVAERVHLSLQLGVGAEVVHYRPGAIANASLHPDAGGTDVQPFGFTRAGARYDVGRVGLSLDALVQFKALRAHYDVELDARRSEIIVPWMVQPGLSGGASW